MRSVFFAVLCVASLQAFAGETLVCESYGYAPTANDFDKIVQGPVHTEFTVEKDKVIKTSIGRVYYAAEPEDFGFEKDVLTFFNRHAHQVLYIYKKDGKLEVGLSMINQDSDDLYLDKDEFTGCGFNGAAVATKASMVVSDRRVNPALPVFTF